MKEDIYDEVFNGKEFIFQPATKSKWRCKYERV